MFLPTPITKKRFSIYSYTEPRTALYGQLHIIKTNHKSRFPPAGLSPQHSRLYAVWIYADRASDIRGNRRNAAPAYPLSQNDADPRTTSSGWMATLVADSFPSILSLRREAHIPPKSSGLLSRVAISCSHILEFG